VRLPTGRSALGILAHDERGIVTHSHTHEHTRTHSRTYLSPVNLLSLGIAYCSTLHKRTDTHADTDTHVMAYDECGIVTVVRVCVGL